MDLTEKLILGKYQVFEENEKTFVTSASVHEVLEAHEVSVKEICAIIRGKPSKKQYLGQLLNSTIDVGSAFGEDHSFMLYDNSPRTFYIGFSLEF